MGIPSASRIFFEIFHHRGFVTGGAVDLHQRAVVLEDFRTQLVPIHALACSRRLRVQERCGGNRQRERKNSIHLLSASRRHLHDAVIGRGLPWQIRQSAAFHLAAHRVELVADERDGVAVHRARERRQNLPAVRDRIIRVERSIRRVVALVLILAA